MGPSNFFLVLLILKLLVFRIFSSYVMVLPLWFDQDVFLGFFIYSYLILCIVIFSFFLINVSGRACGLEIESSTYMLLPSDTDQWVQL